MPTLLSSTSIRPKLLRHAATIASISAVRDTSAVKAMALPPSPAMIFAVSAARADRAGPDHHGDLALEPVHQRLPCSLDCRPEAIGRTAAQGQPGRTDAPRALAGILLCA